MWRLALAQTSSSWKRLVAASIAVTLGAIFVAFTILAAHVFDSSAAQEFRGADLQVLSYSGHVDPASLDQLSAIDHVFIEYSGVVALSRGDAITQSILVATPTDTAVERPTVTEGRPPKSNDEIVISAIDASRLDVGIGDVITVQGTTIEGTVVADESARWDATIVGLTDGDYGYMGSAALMTDTALAQFAQVLPPETFGAYAVLVMTDDIPTATAELETLGWVSAVNSPADLAEQQLSIWTGVTNPILSLTVAFVLVALSVAGLVVANTFLVLAHQRARLIGTLRSLGATRRQIQGTVLLEAAVVGVAGGVMGSALGNTLTYAVMPFIHKLGLPLSWTLPDRPPLSAIVVPIISGFVLTAIAAIASSVAASRTPPLAAVRHITSPRRRATRTMHVLGVVLLSVGVVAAIGTLAMQQALSTAGLGNSSLIPAFAVFSIVLASVGILIIASLIFPPLTNVIGAALTVIVPRKLRVPIRLARTNLVANRQRTTTTTNALLVGIALVAGIMTAADTATKTLEGVAGGMQPTDIVLSTSIPSTGIQQDLTSEISSLPGVTDVAPVYTLESRVTSDTMTTSLSLIAADPQILAAASYSPDVASVIDDSSLIVSSSAGLPQGSRVTIEPVDIMTGETMPGGSPIPLTVQHATLSSWQGMISLNSARELGVDVSGEPQELWIRADGADLTELMNTIATLIPAQSPDGLDPYWVSSPGQSRMGDTEVITTVVAAAVALLGISILIALVGVANTVSLSVYERRRGIALLRTVGLSRSQLRVSLAAEGFTITMAAALVGVALGIVTGVAASVTLFGGAQTALVSVPWADIAWLVLICMIAGVLASIVPSKHAIETSPMEAIRAN